MPSALVIRQIEGKPGAVYYPLELKSLPSHQPTANQLVIRMTAAALNHRDHFMRQHLYPGISFGVPLLADGCGVVTSTGTSAAAKKWLGKRVILNPGTGWEADLEGPESPTGYKILGGTQTNPKGTAVEEFLAETEDVEEAPGFLSDAEAAALPLTGLTAWRAVFVKSGNAAPGRNVLVTGIGGGVAIMALLFLVKAGAQVWVTSGSQEKIKRAVELGAKGGVSYKEKGWEKTLVGMLPEGRKYLDAIVDGAGGDVVEKGMKLLKQGGVISCYGMTVNPKMPFMMGAVMKNIELKGSTMGSRKEFADMVRFVNEKELRPVVSKVAKGLGNIKEIEALFKDMSKGNQFGKLVIEIGKDSELSKL